MKSLFFTYWYPTEEKPQTGVFIQEQAKALKYVGEGVHILHVNIGPGDGLFSIKVEELVEGGLNVTRISILGKLWKYIYTCYPWQLWLLRRIIRKAGIDLSNIDLMHSHVVHPAGAIGHRIAAEHGIPHVIGEQWSNVDHYFSKFLFNSWGKLAYNEAKRVLILSEFLKSRVNRHISEASKLFVVPNVVSAQDFFYQPRIEESEYYVVMAASWNRGKRLIKRPELVIEALSGLSQSLSKPVVLGVIGNGDRVPELKAMAERLGVRVQFLGYMKKQQIGEQFRRADLFLHASEYETFSVVVAEALKSGTPVVASNVAAIPELVNEKCGLLTANTVQDWKNAILRGLNTEFNREAIAESYRLRFGYSEVGKMLSGHYKEVLRTTQPKRIKYPSKGKIAFGV